MLACREVEDVVPAKFAITDRWDQL
jgi:hypothetical protein